MSENRRMPRSGRRHVLFLLVLALIAVGAPSMSKGAICASTATNQVDALTRSGISSMASRRPSLLPLTG
jgi:hypothetical protein